ncbi:ABC transporter substrate-binding protein [Flexivirga alba]|uniref:ABC transporter substrate-binding protein n=1 Tax=Flexivirga alba TaxID=702742 RepID=A0ABW2AJY3_9MICO
MSDLGRLSSPHASRRDVLRWTGGGLLALGVGGALSACGGGGSNSAAGVKKAAGALSKPTTLHIASAPIDNYFLDFVNQDQQDYQKYNLEVPKFILPKSGVQGEQLMTAGSIDAQVQDVLLTMSTFVHSEPGKRPVFVGMRVPETTYSIVVGKGSWPDAKASFQEKMQALKGKTIGVTAIGAGADQQLTLALKQAGMTRKDVTPLAVGQVAGGGAAQMKAGRIAAYVGITWATSRVLAKQTGGRILIEFSDPSVPPLLSKQQVDVCIVREDFAKKHEDVVKAWLASQTAGRDWMVANRGKAAELLNKTCLGGKFPDIAKGYIDHFADDLVPKLHPDWKVAKADIDVMLDVAQQMGIIKKGQISFEDLVPAFARA